MKFPLPSPIFFLVPSYEQGVQVWTRKGPREDSHGQGRSACGSKSADKEAYQGNAPTIGIARTGGFPEAQAFFGNVIFFFYLSSLFVVSRFWFEP
jgi:hypothetical protein